MTKEDKDYLQKLEEENTPKILGTGEVIFTVQVFKNKDSIVWRKGDQ